MKNFISILFFLCAFQTLNAQNWTVGAKWIYEQDEYMPTPEADYLFLTKEKDTLIQSHLCSQILETDIEVDLTIPHEHLGIRHFLWQDGQKINIYDSDSLKFFPLYDFSKSTGDTLLSYCIFSGKTIKMRIDSVSMTSVGSQMLKVQWVQGISTGSCFIYGPVYERVGWIQYLFPRPGFVDPAPGGYLICFSDLLLSFPSGANCTVKVKNAEPNSDSAFKVFPNPTSDRLFFENEDFEIFRVFSLFGQLLKTQNDGKELSLNEFPDGVYLLEIQTSKGILLKKIIKRR